MLDENKIKSNLDIDAEVYVYRSVDSTNDVAAGFIGKTERPVIVVAEGQTQGQGRNGKSFYSPEGTGLYLSVLTHPHSDFVSLNTFTCGAAVAVARAIETLTDIKPDIKWVNDIYLNGKKVCGILCKAVGGNGRVEHLITGIGVNITTEYFPEDIKESAGSLNRDIDKNIFAAEAVNKLFSVKDYMDEYRERSCVLGREITYWENGIPHTAKAVDIDKNGCLVVHDGKEKTTLSGGEITIRF